MRSARFVESWQYRRRLETKGPKERLVSVSEDHD